MLLGWLAFTVSYLLPRARLRKVEISLILVSVSIVVERHLDHGNLYEGKHSVGVVDDGSIIMV